MILKQVLGDEVHFVMMCPQFQKERGNLADNVAKLYPNINHLRAWNQFTWLTSQKDKDCLSWIATFLLKVSNRNQNHKVSYCIRPATHVQVDFWLIFDL